MCNAAYISVYVLNVKLLVFSLHGNSIFELMAERMSRCWVLSRGSLLVSQDLTGFSRNEILLAFLLFSMRFVWVHYCVQFHLYCDVMCDFAF